jgi:hypothetical protein
MSDDVPNDILVMGCAYTPMYGDDESTLFTHDEMNEEFAKSIKNLPVYIEHDKERQVGEVAGTYVNEKQQLMALLHLNSNPIANKLLPPTLYKDPKNGGKGFFNALSLGNDVKFEVTDHGDFTTKRVIGNTPSEISLVRAGNRPNTEIDDYVFLPKNMTVTEYLAHSENPFLVRYK